MLSTQHALELNFSDSHIAAIKSGLCKAFGISGTLSNENAGTLLTLLNIGHMGKMSRYEETLICALYIRKSILCNFGRENCLTQTLIPGSDRDEANHN